MATVNPKTGAALVEDATQAPGTVKAYPDITLAAAAATLVIDPPANSIRFVPVPGDAGADAKFVFCENPPTATWRDAALDLTQPGVRYAVKMAEGAVVFNFSQPVSSIGYKGAGTVGTTAKMSVEAVS